MTKRKKKPIFTGSEWTFDLIDKVDKEIAIIARKYKIDTYPNQIEVISSEQMMDAYASVGMPLMYNHWSYGKHFLQTLENYKRGHMGLAYEIVINSDPCISYLMEENTMAMQTLVIAHAAYGHNSFFKGNYLFKSWTDAKGIIDYILFAKKYIADCEERYGIDAVEEIVDSCHALMNYGVNRYKRPRPLSAAEERKQQEKRAEYIQRTLNHIWSTIPKKSSKDIKKESRFPVEPEENILYFIEKNAPLLEGWQREVVRIVRKIAQYFYPQRQTQVMNEGWACFWHYTLLYELHAKGLITDGTMMEVLHYHSNVVMQLDFDDQHYSGINPYALGFAIFRDLRRICENPTAEDKQKFADIAGSKWLDTLYFAMRNFKDESFIMQFLSPKVIRDFHLFAIKDNDINSYLEIDAIHDEAGYDTIRAKLSNYYNIGEREPNIQIWNVDVKGDRSLTLRHFQNEYRPLGESTTEVLKHIHKLWKFDVHLESWRNDKVHKTFHCPAHKSKAQENSILLPS